MPAHASAASFARSAAYLLSGAGHWAFLSEGRPAPRASRGAGSDDSNAAVPRKARIIGRPRGSLRSEDDHFLPERSPAAAWSTPCRQGASPSSAHDLSTAFPRCSETESVREARRWKRFRTRVRDEKGEEVRVVSSRAREREAPLPPASIRPAAANPGPLQGQPVDSWCANPQGAGQPARINSSDRTARPLADALPKGRLHD
jgi:hypothetical protein